MPRKLTLKQLEAARMLAGGTHPTRIASYLKLRRTTLSRWKRQSEFLEEVERQTYVTKETLQYRLLYNVECAVEQLGQAIRAEHYDYNDKRVRGLMETLERLNTLTLPYPNAPGCGHTRLIQFEPPQTLEIMPDNAQ